ncbi:MAG: substrate-binding domain-containing protein [Anaerolineales bacterium]|jgi:signal transduction histidine kinase/DNA-binding LacI/PurR family transcriptional regulator
MMIPKKSASERKTVGVLLAQISHVWGTEFMAGIEQAAEEHNVNLVCFVGGKPSSLMTPGQLQNSYGLYDLVKPDQFDGLILAADIAHGLSPKEIIAFCRTFAPTPMVAHAIETDGVPHFLADNLKGLKFIMRHLIEVHGYKRIAFIRGVEGQIESEARFEAYKSELEAHGIPFNEKLVVEGDFTPESGRAAIRTLIDKRGVRFQAIVAASDRMAFGALEDLQQRGIPVPDSIALTGFDDVREARSLGVPLTTVQQSFSNIGKQAFETLMKRIEGKTVPHSNVVDTDMVIRWSCGCLPETVRYAVVHPRDVAQTGELENKRDAAIFALLSAANIDSSDPAIQQFRDTFGRMWDVFLTSMKDSTKDSDFLRTINAAIDMLRGHGLDASAWHNMISTLRRYTLAGISGPTDMLHAENLFQQARLMAGELSQRAQAFSRLQFEQQENIYQDFGFSMAPAMSLEGIGDAISKNFPKMGIERWYVMFYSDVSSPAPTTAPPPENYKLLFQYDDKEFRIPTTTTNLGTGSLVPRGKEPEDHRYTAVVMPLSLAKNRFGFMWIEKGPKLWDIYTRIRNLVSSALLRTMLVQQREQAQMEVERLLDEARERATELAVAKDMAEKAAIEKEKLYDSEQSRRQAAEALAKASRQLSSLETVEKVPEQILEQLRQILHFDRGVLYLEDVNEIPNVAAHYGMPKSAPVDELRFVVHKNKKENDMYDSVTRMQEALQVGDVSKIEGWNQPDWFPKDLSWMGVPLFFQDKVLGMLVLTRKTSWAFSKDEALSVNTFAVQAAIAIENARLYDEINRFSQMMERMVAQRVDELSNAYNTLEKLDRNKSTFIQVAAHELRTPLTVMKGYLGMLRGHQAIKDNESLIMAVDGVMQGTNRLHQIVNSMLDVTRLENQVLTPHLEQLSIAPILRLLQKEFQEDLEARNIALKLDENLSDLPVMNVDPGLLQKALNNVVINAIKFTPDGGTVSIHAEPIKNEQVEPCLEIQVKDTGIGIDPENLDIIFEKLYQLGKVELHSSGRTTFKGGGPGLGLAIAAGIVKSHGGKIWAESPGYDEEKLPGSTFFIRLPLPKENAEA